jgi:hypothetical protein
LDPRYNPVLKRQIKKKRYEGRLPFWQKRSKGKELLMLIPALILDYTIPMEAQWICKAICSTAEFTSFDQCKTDLYSRAVRHQFTTSALVRSTRRVSATNIPGSHER